MSWQRPASGDSWARPGAGGGGGGGGGGDKIASETAEALAPIQMTLGPGAHYDLPPFGCTAQLRLTYAWGTLIYGWYDDGGASLASWIGNAPDFALSLQPGKVPRILNTSASGYTFLIQYTRSLP